jgi:lysyl-tRNA synthetase class 2
MNRIQKKIFERNELFTLIREFFKKRNVLEVDTPLFRKFTVTDPYMNAFSVTSTLRGHQGYLQTSPEYAMKQLICDGSGDIFQLSKMFRSEEQSDIHASEFTMLEWYRIGYDHMRLINEVCLFIQNAIGELDVEILSYQTLFISKLKFDPFNISLAQLKEASECLLDDIPENLLFDNYLTLLFSEIIEPQFNQEIITVVHGYPKNQASLAKTRTENQIITADRFEVYCGGMELANGFNELSDASEQLKRFEDDNKTRSELGYENIEIDNSFIQSLKSGLPDCAGVALGVDRLLMVKLNQKKIIDVIL